MCGICNIAKQIEIGVCVETGQMDHLHEMILL